MIVSEKRSKWERRVRRHRRVRKKVKGTAERPRLCVFRSLQHIYVQIINDEEGKTLVAASSLSPEIREMKGTKTEIARAVGRLVAQKALEKGITKVVFDRGGYKYHGRVRALAEGTREVGLLF